MGKEGNNAREPSTARSAHDKSHTIEEPCAVKVASTVL